MKKRIGWLVLGVLATMDLNLTFAAEAAMRNDVGTAKERFERDRRSILALAGTYKVTFDMRETVPFVADYQPIRAKTSGGHEVVKVVEDTGTKISLQHLLVVTGNEGTPSVVKHWRQSWVYEPKEVLVYTSANRWIVKALTSAERAGVWSQTVWQTDDSPRYGGVGRWVYDDGVSRWTSDATLRPLARRDAVRHPVYNRYLGTNRHALTPSGWVHEQDNAKLGPGKGQGDGKTLTFVHEVVVNTYARATDFDVAAADQYWDKTKNYWAAVRSDWEAAIHRNRGISVKEEAENGSKTGPTLMMLANRIANGEIEMSEAIAAAKVEISRAAVESSAEVAAKL